MTAEASEAGHHLYAETDRMKMTEQSGRIQAAGDRPDAQIRRR